MRKHHGKDMKHEKGKMGKENKAHEGKMHNMPEQKARWKRAYNPHGPKAA